MRATKKVVGFVAGFAAAFLTSKVLLNREKPAEPIEELVAEEELPEEIEDDFCAVFVVRKDLKMRQGKIAAQCGHASLGIFQKIVKMQPLLAEKWLNAEFPKVFYYCTDEEQMNLIDAIAQSMGYATVIIHDAGRTQIAAGSATVLSFGPVRKSEVSAIVDQLGLVAIP